MLIVSSKHPLAFDTSLPRNRENTRRFLKHIGTDIGTAKII